MTHQASDPSKTGEGHDVDEGDNSLAQEKEISGSVSDELAASTTSSSAVDAEETVEAGEVEETVRQEEEQQEDDGTCEL